MEPANDAFCCTVCTEIINDANTSSIQCMKCKSWSHTKCSVVKEVFDLLAKVKNDKGKRKPLVLSGLLLYVCEPCGATITETTSTSSTQSTLPQNSTSTTTSTQPIPTNTTTNRIDHNSAQSSSQNTANNEVDASSHQILDGNSPNLICHHYKQGRCWHGKSGQKIYNGRKCLNLHPEKCIKYCRFGHDKFKGGCSGNCGLLHPTLCRNSLRYKECYLEKCTFAHLAGTERHRRYFSPQPNQHHPGLIPNSSFPQNNQDMRFSEAQRYQPNVHFSTQSRNIHPTNIRKQREEFLYQQKDFPPLSSTNDVKMNEISLSISQLQKSIDFLMHSVQFKDAPPQPRLQPNFHQIPPHAPNPVSYSEAKNLTV